MYDKTMDIMYIPTVTVNHTVFRTTWWSLINITFPFHTVDIMIVFFIESFGIIYPYIYDYNV